MKLSHYHPLFWALLFLFLPFFSVRSQGQDSSILIMSQNSQYSIETGPNFEKKFDIVIETPGKWHFWVETCGSPVDLTIENREKDTKIMTIAKGESYLHLE